MATDDRNRPAAPHTAPAKRSFFGELMQDMVRVAAKMVIAFATATAIAAGVCLYYGFPLYYALAGGVGIVILLVVLIANS